MTHSTTPTTTPPVVFVLQIVDEHNAAIYSPQLLVYPNNHVKHVGISDIQAATMTGMLICRCLSSANKEMPPHIWRPFLGEHGFYSFWLDGQSFICLHESVECLNEALLFVPKHSDVTTLLNPLQPNTHYWVTIRLLKNSAEVLFSKK
jgi:hypothetical protein